MFRDQWARSVRLGLELPSVLIEGMLGLYFITLYLLSILDSGCYVHSSAASLWMSGWTKSIYLSGLKAAWVVPSTLLRCLPLYSDVQWSLILNAFQPESTWTDLPYLSLRGSTAPQPWSFLCSACDRFRSFKDLCPSSVLCKVGMATCLRWNDPFDTVFWGTRLAILVSFHVASCCIMSCCIMLHFGHRRTLYLRCACESHCLQFIKVQLGKWHPDQRRKHPGPHPQYELGWPWRVPQHRLGLSNLFDTPGNEG